MNKINLCSLVRNLREIIFKKYYKKNDFQGWFLLDSSTPKNKSVLTRRVLANRVWTIFITMTMFWDQKD